MSGHARDTQNAVFCSALHHSPERHNPEEALDIDFITHDLFHQPTLTENDIAEKLVIEPFPEGAPACR